MQFTHFVGIDVSKSWLDFALMGATGDDPVSFRVKNTIPGVFRALKRVKAESGAALGRVRFCLEHTGVYCYPFLQVAARSGLSFSLESAWKIKRSHSPRGKNDRLDAVRICDYARRYHDQLRDWAREDDVILELKHLMSLRRRLKSLLSVLQVPIKELRAVGAERAADAQQELCQPVIEATRDSLKELEGRVRELIASVPEISRSFELVTSIKGVGAQTAIWLILYTHNFQRIPDPKKLACYAGVAPFEYSSGSSYQARSRVSNYANKRLKKVLHMAALSAVRHNNDLRAYYARRVAEGKNKMSVLNAVRNKIIHIVYAVIKRQSPYDENQKNIPNKLCA